MKDLVARLIAYVFAGSFCVAGPLLLVIALGSALQRVALVYSGARVEGTVVAKQPTGSAKVTYAPVFEFAAADAGTYTVISDVYGQESAFKYGEHVPVLYPLAHPQAARIDTFSQLWTFPLVFGVVGGGFSIIPALILVNWMRRRQAIGGGPATIGGLRVDADSASRGLRWALGLLFAGGGVVLIGMGVTGSPALHGSRFLVTNFGVLFASCGVLVGQWVTTGSRLYQVLGGAAMTSMASMFGWIAMYGDASGFSGGASVGGMAVSGGSVAPARIAFGIGAIAFGLSSLWAWKQVLRRPE